MMRKAEALGLETRNVPSAYLLPVLTRGSAGGSSLSASGSHTAIASGGSFHEPLNLSPKALTAMRTTRMLQSLGQKVIFSNDPYVNSAFESLLTTRVTGVPPDLAPDLAELISRKPPGGRLRPKGSKAAALRRAKRLVGAGAMPVASEVPFVDALRVCDLERDRGALPALLRHYVFSRARVVVPRLEEYCEAMGRLRPAPMLQAAALLMQQGYFFAAIKVVYSNFEALQATLAEMEALIAQHMDTGDWDTASALWHWKDPDRELFLKQFKELRIISYYLDVRKQLRALKEAGVVALARVEREMLLKVIQDFRQQLEEDFAAHRAQMAKEAEERARAKAKLDAQARAAAEAAARRAEEAAKVEAKARAAADVKAKREAEMRGKAKEMDRKREEVRKRAEELRKKGGPPKTGPAAAQGGALEDDGPLVVEEWEVEPGPEESMAEASENGGTQGGEEAGPAAEASDAVVAAEAGDKVSELGRGSSTGQRTPLASRDGARASTSSGGVSRGGGRSGAGTGTGDAPAQAGDAVEEDAVGAADAAGADSVAAEGAAEEAEATPAAPDDRPPVRVHLRPHSRGLTLQLSFGAGADGPAVASAPPVAAESSEAEELRRGIEEMRRAMSLERRRADAAAEQLKAMAAVKGSRPTTPAIKLNINLMAGTTDEKLREMEAALEAERAVFQQKLEEERAALAAVLAEERSKLEEHFSSQKKLFDEERQRLLRDLYEQQGRDLDQQLVASVQSIEALKQQRDMLRSAGGNGGSRHSSGRNAAAAEEAARLEAAVKMLEKKLDDELSHVKQLEDEKTRVETERLALEEAQRLLEAQKSQAELEKAKAEQEKGALQEQIAKTMRMFQEQLAQTVKMAAMLQAQRILGAATGGVAPSLAMTPMGPVATPLGLMPQSSAGSISMLTPPSLGMLPVGSASMGAAAAAAAAGVPGSLTASPSLGASAASLSMLPAPVASLPQEVDDPPTQDEIIAYGKYLGMDVAEDADLLYIAEWALTAPLPEGWTVHLDGEGNEFFYNAATNASTYEHPMDEHYRAYYRKMKEQKQLQKMTEAQQAAGA
ncbi:hypothetical protein GPECTOR_50g621 [Gonium pectorale]|uniref:WW domain-containing protein n=1 Tax=Gonium pectorale TaxID=33097 RepID=A0A150G7K6_GONPE|nr:hypothetical protein GPECTOR_50g621 [Gonium pectorale]|eukprot:KXZ45827.1 hypothetical protein GPECTOR_50g621 [Gonium pectorale]